MLLMINTLLRLHMFLALMLADNRAQKQHFKGGDSDIKVTALFVGNFEKVLKSTRILLCGRGSNSFSPRRDTNSNDNSCLSYIFPGMSGKSQTIGDFAISRPSH